MLTWVLLAFLWNGNTMDGTIIEVYKAQDIERCKARATSERLMDLSRQYICWPDVKPIGRG